MEMLIRRPLAAAKSLEMEPETCIPLLALAPTSCVLLDTLRTNLAFGFSFVQRWHQLQWFRRSFPAMTFNDFS